MDFFDSSIPRPTYPVLSIHHQTLLSKALFEHAQKLETISAVALASKSIQNSSLAPNLASNFVIDPQTMLLFTSVFDPSTSLPLQFVPELNINCSWYARPNLVAPAVILLMLMRTKYFCRSLRNLTMRYPSEIDMMTLLLRQVDEEFFFSSCLQSLKLFGFNPTDHRVLSKIEKKFPELTSFEVTFHDAIGNENVVDFCSSVVNLKLSPEFLAAFRCIGFPGGDMISRPGYDALAKCSAFAPSIMKNLSTLSFAYCRQLADGDLIAIVKNLSSSNTISPLRCLELVNCDRLTDESVKAIGEHLPEITTLDLEGIFQISDDALETLSTACSNLTKINLENCHGITDMGILYLSRLADTLCWLSLVDCDRLTDLSCDELRLLKRCTALDLSGCNLVSEKGIEKLVREDAPIRKSLRCLKLAACDKIAIENRIRNY